MENEKKYRFRDNFYGDSHQFVSLREAKQAAKQLTFGYPIYIFSGNSIVAVVKANDKPLP